MCIETATHSTHQSQVSRGLRMARHLGGEVFQAILDMCAVWRTCSTLLKSCNNNEVEYNGEWWVTVSLWLGRGSLELQKHKEPCGRGSALCDQVATSASQRWRHPSQ